jgi:hypothetical protein
MAKRKYKYGVRVQIACNTEAEAKSLKEIYESPQFAVMLASNGLSHVSKIISGPNRISIESLSVPDLELLRVVYGEDAVADVKAQDAGTTTNVEVA